MNLKRPAAWNLDQRRGALIRVLAQCEWSEVDKVLANIQDLNQRTLCRQAIEKEKALQCVTVPDQPSPISQ